MRFRENRIDTSPIPVSRATSPSFVAQVESEVGRSLSGMKYRYAPSDDVTLELSVPFPVRKPMDDVTADGEFHETNSGIREDDDRHAVGDVKLLGHVPVYADGPYRAHLTDGVLAPPDLIRQTT